MIFAAVVIPVTVQAILCANRAGLMAEKRVIAAALANETLTEMILTEDWVDGEQEGDFEEMRPGYRWEVTNELWDDNIDSIMLVRLEVFFDVQGRENSVALDTLAELPGEEQEESE